MRHFSFIFFHFVVAFSALSDCIIFSFNYSSIFFIKNMTFSASFFCSAISTIYIYLLSNTLKMIWIYTYCILTKMIYNHSFWNFSFMDFIRISMGKIKFFIYSILSILSIFACNPFPTTFSFFNLCKKFFVVHNYHIHQSTMAVQDS